MSMIMSMGMGMCTFSVRFHYLCDRLSPNQLAGLINSRF